MDSIEEVGAAAGREAADICQAKTRAGNPAGAGFDMIGTGAGPFAYVVPASGGAPGNAGTSGNFGAAGGTGSLYVKEFFAE
jgi:hypothetical protein